MRTYCVAVGPNLGGWPYLSGGQAYLVDGTPLTERDQYGRVIVKYDACDYAKISCAGGLTSLEWRKEGVRALARALDKGDAIRAPLVLLFLQIDPVPGLAKYNPFHKPKGPGGGQFASGAQGEASSSSSTSSAPSGFIEVAYPGTYHDQVRDELAAAINSSGGLAITEVPLDSGWGFGARIDLLVLDPRVNLLPYGIEVKTGKDPAYSWQQLIIYPMLVLGLGLTTSDKRLKSLGLGPKTKLPPIPIYQYYKPGPNVDGKFEKLPGLWSDTTKLMKFLKNLLSH